jgi:hypothetical protein
VGRRGLRAEDLLKFFDPGCYSSIEDDGKHGFFEVYRRVFVRLDEEEEGEEDTDTYHKAAPGFGSADTPHSEVAAFYREWCVASPWIMGLTWGIFGAKTPPQG